MIYLAELTVATDAAGATTVLRYSSGNGYAHSSATGYYEPRIMQPANLQRTAFGSGTTGGAITVGFGELVLNNVDGGLDSLIDYGFDGRSFKLLIGDETGAYGDFVTVMSGTMEQPTFSWRTMSVRIRDRLEELERRPVQTAKYAGSNSLPAGLEGTADDLAGRPKPRVYGVVYNIAPPLVNTARLIYQVNDGAVNDVSAVYDKGLALTKGADYSNQSDMETNAPAVGQYRIWKAGGYFRLGSTPDGQITADVTQGASAANRTTAQILKALATGPGGIASGEVSSSDVTALDTAASAEIGLWIVDEISVRAAMETVANSVGGWFGFDRSGVLRMKRLEAPSGTPDLILKSFVPGTAVKATDADILEIERLPTNDAGRGVPVYRVILKHGRNWTAGDRDLAAAVTAARKAWLAEEWRTATATDAAVQAKHLLAGEMEFETLLVSAAAAGTEATRRLALYGTRRDRLRLRVRLDSSLAAVVDLGSIVSVELPRFGYDAGKLFVVLGMEYDAARNIAELEVWG
jgi:hypothetical protein